MHKMQFIVYLTFFLANEETLDSLWVISGINQKLLICDCWGQVYRYWLHKDVLDICSNSGTLPA